MHLTVLLLVVQIFTYSYCGTNQQQQKSPDVTTVAHDDNEVDDDTCAHLKKDKKTATCTLFPKSVEGPYYVYSQEERGNITEGKPGIPFELHLKVVNFTTCKPLANVAVDLWQCDGLGVYSYFQQLERLQFRNQNTFLRGVQYTNGKGEVIFDTIFPGWYSGRTVHIHVDAWVNHKKHTGQLFFSEQLTKQVAALAPYNKNTSPRTTNVQDEIFNKFGGVATTLSPDFTMSGLRAALLLGFIK